MKLIVVTANETDGKIMITKEELQRIVDEVYLEGQKDIPTISTPWYPSVPTAPQYISPITCEDRREE